MFKCDKTVKSFDSESLELSRQVSTWRSFTVPVLEDLTVPPEQRRGKEAGEGRLSRVNPPRFGDVHPPTTLLPGSDRFTSREVPIYNARLDIYRLTTLLSLLF